MFARGAFFKCGTPLMLRIGAQQRGQWGLGMLARPGRSILGRRVGVEIAACKGKAGFNLGFSSSSRNDIALRRTSSWKRRKGVLDMENAGVTPRAAEVDKPFIGEEGMERLSSLHSKINKWSKWVVVLLVAIAMLWMHDYHALWFMVGSISSGGLAKLLKYLINENRPPTAEGVKEDPGMPSSHAQGFSYIATYATLAWLSWKGITVWTSISSIGILLSLAYLSWLRVEEGLHTVPQVLVGCALGISTATFWFYVWKGVVEAAVYSSPSAKLSLYIFSVAAFVLCYFISFKNWQFGEP